MGKEFDYKKWVGECYDKKLNQEIDNASRKHAFLLFEKLLDKAYRDGEDVKIISNQLFADFYENLIDKVQKIIDNGNKVEIIVEKEVENGNAFYAKFKQFIQNSSSNFDGLPNFIVVGDHAFRYETDKNSIKAIANFNDKKMGVFISNLFTNIKKQIA